MGKAIICVVIAVVLLILLCAYVCYRYVLRHMDKGRFIVGSIIKGKTPVFKKQKYYLEFMEKNKYRYAEITSKSVRKFHGRRVKAFVRQGTLAGKPIPLYSATIVSRA